MKKRLKKIQKAILLAFLMFSVSLTMGPSPVFAATVSDSFADKTKINTSSSSVYQVIGGQLKLAYNLAALGDGADGAVTISAAKNINTDTIGTGRTVADGISYEVNAIGTNTVTPGSSVLALNKTSSQSSVYSGLGANLCNDGNTGNYCHTNSEVGWWKVDLGASYTVTQIKLWNRADCCQDRVDNFKLQVSTTGAFTGEEVDVYTAVNTQAGRPSTYNITPTSGRYIRLLMTVTDYLNFAEMEVIGNVIPDGIAAGDDLLLINMQGDATNNGNVGTYEILTVQSISGSTITFTSNVTGTYGVGGNSDLTGQKIMIQRVPNYTDVTINNGISLTANSWDGTKGGIVAFRANGNVNIAGTISMATKGYRLGTMVAGGSGKQGESYGGLGAQLTAANFGAGGGGIVGVPGRNGGGGGHTNTGGQDTGYSEYGVGGGTYGNISLTKLYMGSGGGGGGRDASIGDGANGGNGGGIVVIGAHILNVTGAISVNGQAGSANSAGDGGGGSGGSVKIDTAAMTLGSSLITALGGAAGGTNNSGSVGRIAVSYVATTSGTTNPSANSTQVGESFLTPATIQSTNVLTGLTGIDSIDTVTYNLSSKPVGTTATIQYSQNASSWYNSGGTLGGTDDLTTGTNNTINVHNLGWSGANFYYKIAFTGNSSSSPVLDDISLIYTVSGYTDSSSSVTDPYDNTTKINTSTSSYYGVSGSQAKIGWSSIKGFWKMDEPSGTSVSDTSGNNNTGTTGASLPNVAFWRLNETADNSCTGGQDACDTTSNNYHANATGTTIVSGKYGNGRNFNGSGDYIYLPVTTSPTSYTIEAWVKPTTGAITNRNVICRTSSAGCASAWSHQLKIDANGKFVHYTYDGGGKTVTGTTTVVADTWYHVAIVATNSSVARLFVNGVEEGTAVAVGTLWTGGDRYYLGAAASGISSFGGIIDDVRIYTTAYTATSILDHSLDVYQGGPTVVTGQYSNARNYTTSDYVTVADSAGLRLSSTGMTWEAWINLSNIGNYRNIIYKNGNYIMRVDNPAEGNKISCFTYLNGAWQTRASSTNIPSTATWIHAACTWDGSNTRIYINGSLNGSPVANSGTPNALTDALYLGNGYAGSIDDVRIYDYARNSTQISEDMNSSPSFPTSGTIYSTNLLTGISNISSINSFVYNLSTLPSGATATISFSNDGTVWYNSSGAAGGTNSLSTGTNNTISLSTLGWIGGNFYYKIALTGDGTNTPTLDDITVNYTVTTSNIASTWSSCKPILGGNFILTENCYFPNTLLSSPETNIDGADNGDITVKQYKTLTIKKDQQIVRNNGKSIIIESGGAIAINDLTEGSGGNVRDYSGNGYEGRALGAIVIAGKYGRARSLNGSSDYVDLETNLLGTALNGASGATLTAWVKPSSFPTSGNRSRILNVVMGDGITGASLNLYNDAGTTKIEGGGRSVTSDTFQTTTANFSDTTAWHHVAAVFNFASDTVKVYLDGVETSGNVTFANTTYTQGTPPAAQYDSIGRLNNSSEWFAGQIDDVRLYNYARSATQIVEDKDYAPNPTGNGPLAWWRFEDGGQIKETNLWLEDADGDGWIFGLETKQKARVNSPGTGWVRRNTVIGSITGDARDGNLTFTVDTNLNTYNHPGRTCADGGDMVNYNISSLGSTINVHGHTVSTATLSSTPSTGCLSAGDIALMVNLQGTSTSSTNTGNYEFMKIYSVSSNVVTFTSAKLKYYGDGAADDTNLGTATSNQRVMLQRVPQYGNVTVNSSINLTPSAWNGQKGGVLAISANGTVTATGNIHATSLGYRGGATGSGLNTPAYNGEGFDGYNGTGGVYNGFGTNGGGAGSNTNQSVSPAGTRGGGGASGNMSNSTLAGSKGAVGGGGGGGYAGGGGGGGGGDGQCGYGSGGAAGTGGDTGTRGGGGGGGGAGCEGGNGGNAGSGGQSGFTCTPAGTGGAVASSDSATAQGGGGGGASETASGGGGGGGMYGIANLSKIYFGSGGGGGGGERTTDDSTDRNTSPGKAGGGIVIINANTITISGTVAAKGTDGSSNYNGGSGAGGSILLRAVSATLGSSLVNAAGGTASTPSSCTVMTPWGGGGAGGVGRIAIGATNITGTSSPTYTSITAP